MGIPILRGRTFDSSKRLDKPTRLSSAGPLPASTFLMKIRLASTSAYAGEMPSSWELRGIPATQSGKSRGQVQYYPLDAGVETVGTLVIRSRRELEQFALPVQRIVAGIDRDLPVSDVLTMDQLLGKTTLNQSFNTTLLVASAALALILAAVGLFGVMSYIAAQRTTEVGIRIALGAKREYVMRKMLLDGMWPAIVGLVMGLTASLAAGRLMRDLLYESKPLDPAVFVAVAAILLAVAALACVIPAWRASHLDPMQALRSE